MLGELTGKHEPHHSLDFLASDRWLLVVPRKPQRILGELVEDVVDEAIPDSHGLTGDLDVRRVSISSSIGRCDTGPTVVSSAKWIYKF